MFRLQKGWTLGLESCLDSDPCSRRLILSDGPYPRDSKLSASGPTPKVYLGEAELLCLISVQDTLVGARAHPVTWSAGPCDCGTKPPWGKEFP